MKSDLGFTSSDICKIIKVCAEGGVSCFSLGEIKIEFRSLSSEAKPSLSTFPTDELSQPLVIEEAKAMAKIIEDQATKLESIRLKEEELENMPILDPEKWEEYESNKVWKADLDAESY